MGPILAHPTERVRKMYTCTASELTLFRTNSVEVSRREPSRERSVQPAPAFLIPDLMLGISNDL